MLRFLPGSALRNLKTSRRFWKKGYMQKGRLHLRHHYLEFNSRLFF
ncbi:unnamed protein product [Prunus brigantina]